MPTILTSIRTLFHRSQPPLCRLRPPIRAPLHPNSFSQQLPRSHGPTFPPRLYVLSLPRDCRSLFRRHLATSTISLCYCYVGRSSTFWPGLRPDDIYIRSTTAGMAIFDLGTTYHRWIYIFAAYLLFARDVGPDNSALPHEASTRAYRKCGFDIGSGEEAEGC